jgi:hypothetical protein
MHGKVEAMHGAVARRKPRWSTVLFSEIRPTLAAFMPTKEATKEATVAPFVASLLYAF